MNRDIIFGWLLGTVGTVLQYFLTRRQTRIRSLVDMRRVTYAKLVSVSMSEWKYPGTPSREAFSEDQYNKFNEHLNEWHRNRKMIKSVAAEALLLTQNFDLQHKLKEFISSPDPEKRLVGIEELLRKEIEV